MNLQITTPFLFFELDVRKWLITIELSFERDDWWIVNFSINYKYLIIWSRRLRRRVEL
jgi:hypothetical protein